jgi:hypothetical protein
MAANVGAVEGEPPILEFDPDGTAVIEPSMVRERLDVPDRAVVCFFSDVI